MGYQALYRVWRPKRFDDLIGQHHVTKTLQNAIVSQKLSHAYLFTGPRGTGKTTAAKIVAKAVNCEQSPTQEPCNECSNCLSITDGSNPDVIEIDAASHRGIDNIRDLRDKVKYAPSQATSKVYIIDEVHMLSTEAFNALLKTLEEPPRHVIFILATTEPHKVPATIISRCQRFDFKRISNQAIVQRMEMILNEGEFVAEHAALSLIARAAEGGMRDALSILDQVISFSDSEITVDDVLSVTGTVSEAILARTILAFLQQDVEEALQVVEEIHEHGKDPARYIEDLILYLRDLLLFQTAPNLEEVQERSSEDEQFQLLAEKCPKQWIYSVIHLLNDSKQEMRWTTSKRIFVEVAFVKICHENNEHDLGENAEQIEQMQAKIEQLDSEITRLQEQLAGKESQAEPVRKERTSRQPRRGTRQSLTQVEHMLRSASKQQLSQLQRVWGEIMEMIRREKISAHAWLKDSQPVACTEDTFLLAFPYEMHSQMASKDQIRETVKQAVQAVYKKPMQYLTIVEDDWEKVKQSFIQNQREETSAETNEKEEEDPLISEAKRLFGEELIEFKNTGGINDETNG